MRVCLHTSLCCLSLSTVILQEHSNCPIHRLPGALSSPPMTKRSILQHQRCQPPLLEQTIRRRVRCSGLDDARNDHSRPLSTSFSHFLLFIFPQCGAGQRSECRQGFLLSQSPQFPFWSFFFSYLQMCCCYSCSLLQHRDKQTSLAFQRKRRRRGGGWRICWRIIVCWSVHNLPLILKRTAAHFSHNDTYQLFTYELYIAHTLYHSEFWEKSTAQQNSFMLRWLECVLHIHVFVCVCADL